MFLLLCWNGGELSRPLRKERGRKAPYMQLQLTWQPTVALLHRFKEVCTGLIEGGDLGCYHWFGQLGPVDRCAL